MELSPRAINDMSDRAYHHHDSTKAASTFMLDAPPNDSVVQGSSGFVSQQTNHNTVSPNHEKSEIKTLCDFQRQKSP